MYSAIAAAVDAPARAVQTLERALEQQTFKLSRSWAGTRPSAAPWQERARKDS
jgi:hypothetical protein